MSQSPAWRTPKAFRVAAPLFLIGAVALASTRMAVVVPNEILMPGTQPLEVQPFPPSQNCELCHGQYDPEVEPFETWSGSMMAHASRDPLFWAAMAVAETDFDGSGDLCLRCHAPSGWYDGRSTPTDGSSLVGDDFDGVTCELCHKLTNPDNSEHLGVMNPPFIANSGGPNPTAWTGSSEASLYPGFERLGPYSDPFAFHGWLQSSFHRQSAMCGTCHDLSNPLTGDLAPNNGAQTPLAPGQFDGTLGGPLADKAAFKNAPHKFGVDQRTYSEHAASPFEFMKVSTFHELPATLRKGSLLRAYNLARASTPTGDYEDGTIRNFTCQTCHMAPVTGYGCGLIGTPLRTDVPKHDLTGGNYWTPDAILYLEAQNRLVGGNGLSLTQIAGMQSGKLRAVENLEHSAAMSVSGNTLRVTNLTGHKLISGYAEGRRMWLNVRWYDASNALVREDGEYGPLNTTINGQPAVVDTILDLNDPNTRVYEAQMAITQDWAAKLLTLGTSASLPIGYDRATGAVTKTLGQLAAQAPGTSEKSFHLVLNNEVKSDNRIPPFGMSYDEALERNIVPVPAAQYGNPGPGGTYVNYDDVALNPPLRAVRADIRLMYQPTSWEYIQFLDLANPGTNPFTAGRGDDILEAWLATGMAAPVVMTEARWGAPAPVNYCTAKTTSNGCTPQIGYTGVPSATAGRDFYLTAENVVNGRAGLLRYSTLGAASTPFKGGFICVAGPVARVALQTSGGNPSRAVVDCSGGFVVDFNQYIASGANPTLVANQQVWAQWWFRDPGFAAPNSLGFTGGISFVIEP
jgi:hypothetical protein